MKRIHLLLASVLALTLGILAVPAHTSAAERSTNAAPTANRVPLAIQAQIGIHWDTVDLGGGPVVICEMCGSLLELRHRDKINPEAQRIILDAILKGMHNLGLAKSTEKPELAREYRTAAMNNFTNAAETVMGGVVINFTPIGYYDLKSGKAIPAENEALNALAQSLTDGISLLQKSLAGGSPKLREEALATFDGAIKHLGDAAARSGGVVINI